MNSNKKDLIRGIEQGDRRSLSKAITLAESTVPDRYELALEILEHFGPQEDSFRIGITGTPGSGKSTFINAIGQEILAQNARASIAVLTIDPSSSISGGSILGDKTRMNALATQESVYIRPTASGNYAGGLSRRTRMAILMCEAAGFKNIIIETVGVGQGETELSQLSDMFVLLLNPGGGDELQGIKRGIIEMADLILVNKADGDTLNLAEKTAKDYAMALHLMPETESGWKPKVLTCSSLQSKKLDAVLGAITEYRNFCEKGFKSEHRRKQKEFWISKNIQMHLEEQFRSYSSTIEQHLNEQKMPERIALEFYKDFVRRLKS